ncbi:hypothetical protein evm_006470 [Chilo suppressalis]|nr:hypothetical protein evm_006470 [Chilo suppressalis]
MVLGLSSYLYGISVGAGVGGGVGAGGSPAGGFSSTPPPTLVRWCGRRRSLALAGPAPAIRLWDAAAELLQRDIPTQCDAGVTSLWRGAGSYNSVGGGAGGAGGDGDDGGWQLTAGFGDGSVRAWDERAPSTAPLYCLHHHAAPVLTAAARPHERRLLTAAADGSVHVYDVRALPAKCASVRAPGPLAAADVHPRANLMACGSINQCISMFDLAGTHLNTIKFHEGFMGARIGPVSCLTFHPLRVAMGVGSKDSSVCVYVSEARR